MYLYYKNSVIIEVRELLENYSSRVANVMTLRSGFYEKIDLRASLKEKTLSFLRKFELIDFYFLYWVLFSPMLAILTLPLR